MDSEITQAREGNILGPVYLRESWNFYYDIMRFFTCNGYTYLYSQSFRFNFYTVNSYNSKEKSFDIVIDSGYFSYDYTIVEFFEANYSLFMFAYSPKHNKYFLYNIQNFSFPKCEVGKLPGFLTALIEKDMTSSFTLSKIFYFKGAAYMITYNKLGNVWQIAQVNTKAEEPFKFYRLGSTCFECDSMDVMYYQDRVFLFIHSKATVSRLCELKEGYPIMLIQIKAMDYLKNTSAKAFSAGPTIYIFYYSENKEWFFYRYRPTYPIDDFTQIGHGTFENYYKLIDVYKDNGDVLLYGLTNNGSMINREELFIRPLLIEERYKLESWMGDLPCAENVNLKELKIPATHNSGAFTKDFVYNLRNACQSLNIGEQLKCGARMFDIRIIYKYNTFFMHHNGFVFDEQNFYNALTQIWEFMSKNQHEIIILKLSQFIGISKVECKILCLAILNHFEKLSFKNTTENSTLLENSLTMRDMLKRGTRIIIFCQELAEYSSVFWSCDYLIHTWQRDINSFNSLFSCEYYADKLTEHVTQKIRSSRGNAFSIIDYYLYNGYGTIPACASTSQFACRSFIRNSPWSLLKKYANIFALDFFHENSAKDIIELNF